MIKKRLKIIAVTGFAQPACLIVDRASTFRCTIFLEYNGVTVNLKNSYKSIIDLVALGVRQGTYVEIYADGCDEQKALQTIEQFLSQNRYVDPETKEVVGDYKLDVILFFIEKKKKELE